MECYYNYYYDYYNYYYDLSYKTLFNVLNYLLDYILYYKIQVQESFHFKMLCDYVYPKNNIVHAKLCNNDSCIDITDHFNNLLNRKDIEKLGWEKLVKLHEEIEKLSKSDKFHLDIRYMMHNNYYRIMYYYNEEIKFPPYSSEQVKEYKENGVYKRTVLYAELGKNGEIQDITNIIKEYSGPLDNFYKDHDIFMHACLIKDDKGEHMLKEDEGIITVTDSHANDIEIKSGDILKI